jgi:hypothetical protein
MVPKIRSIQFLIEMSVDTSPIDFGKMQTLPDKDIDATGSLKINCTPGVGYNVLLGDGKAGTGPTTRKMFTGASPGGQSIAYGLYSDAGRTASWGDTTTSGGKEDPVLSRTLCTVEPFIGTRQQLLCRHRRDNWQPLQRNRNLLTPSTDLRESQAYYQRTRPEKAKGRELPDLPKLTSTSMPVHPWSKMEISYSLCGVITPSLRQNDDAVKSGSAYAIQIALENKVNDHGKDRVNRSALIGRNLL